MCATAPPPTQPPTRHPVLRQTPEQIDAAVRQLVSSAIATNAQAIDVFTAAGLSKPDISMLSDQFLAETRGLKHKNVAARWRSCSRTRSRRA